MIVRNAKPSELDILINLGEQLFIAEKQFEPLLKYSKEEWRQKYTDELNNPDALFLVAVETDSIVGYAYAHLDLPDYLSTTKKQCEIEAIYVPEKHRGKGIGTKLANGCIDWAKKKSSFRVISGVYFVNNPSIDLFKKAGFVGHHLTLSKNLDE